MKTKYKCCGKILKTPFCPNCGTKETDSEKLETLYPLIYKTYAHGDKESGSCYCDENNIENENVRETIIYSNYEMSQTISINEDGTSEIVECNGIPVLAMREMLERLYIFCTDAGANEVELESIKDLILEAGGKIWKKNIITSKHSYMT